MKKDKNYIFLLVGLIILFIVLSFNLILKDYFNMFLELIYLKKDEKLVISNDLTDTYITSLEKDINEYKEITKLKDCINGTVIYRNPIYWYDELTINKGSIDNINVGDTVINNEGIIGIVSDVYENSSVISLITNINDNRKITVGITNNEETIYGIISEYDKNKNELIISELTKEISVDGNSNVMTTSFTNTFKEGIIIAKVKNIVDESNGLSKKAITTPVVDYNNIKYVCVMENK